MSRKTKYALRDSQRSRKRQHALKESDFVTHLFDQNIDLESRTLYVGSRTFSSEGDAAGVDAMMAEHLIKGIHLLNRMNDLKITVIMNNPGGDVMDGYAMYDAITHSQAPVDIMVYGQASSMGSIILQAGRKRSLTPNTVMMIHDGYSKDSERITMRSDEAWGEWSKKDRMRMYEIYASRSGRDVDYWKKACSHDHIFMASEAVKERLADEIIPAADWRRNISKY